METQRTRRVLVDTAARLLVKDRGASLGEIAAAAGVGRTTLHRYFAGRDDLVVAVALDALDRAEAAVEASVPGEGAVAEAFLRAAQALIPIAPQLEFLLTEASLSDETEVRRRGDEVIAPLLALAERGRHDGLVRHDVTADWVVDAFLALLLAAWDGIDDGRLAPKLAPRLVTDTLLGGVANHPWPPAPSGP